jgi:hypothetical protein
MAHVNWRLLSGKSGFALGSVMWDLWWTMWHLNRFFFTFSSFLCQYHSTMAPHSYITWGVNNRPVGDRRSARVLPTDMNSKMQLAVMFASQNTSYTDNMISLSSVQTEPCLLSIFPLISDDYCQYRLLRAGRPGDRGSIPGGGKWFFL